jgi:hypothetical protein
MATKRLWGPTLADATAETVFTCPTGDKALLESITYANPAGGGAANLVLSIGTDAAGTRFVVIPVPAGPSSATWPLNVVLNSTEVVQQSATTDDVIVVTGNGKII